MKRKHSILKAATVNALLCTKGLISKTIFTECKPFQETANKTKELKWRRKEDMKINRMIFVFL